MLIVVFDVCHRSSAAISGVIGIIVLLLPFRTLRMQAGDFIVIGQRVAGQVNVKRYLIKLPWSI